MHVECAMRSAWKDTENCGSCSIGIGRRTHECTHRCRCQREQIGNDVCFSNARNLRYASRLEKVCMIVVGRVVNGGRLGGRASGVNHFPEYPLVQWKVGQLKAKTFRVIHQVLLGRKRQTFKLGQRVDLRNIYPRLIPLSLVVRVAACA